MNNFSDMYFRCILKDSLGRLLVADFKNVSIVGHYIKERTKDAQFVIIRLALLHVMMLSPNLSDRSINLIEQCAVL
jgi:hypothetical protein